MRNKKKSRMAGNIVLFVIVLLLLGGCKQVTQDTHGAVYGSVLLAEQQDHSGVIVTAVNGSLAFHAVTEKSGFYVISGLSPGIYEVTVSKEGWYVPEENEPTKSIVITEGESVMNVGFVMDSDMSPPAIPQ